MMHQCIRQSCKNSYEDDETDAYYCLSCRERNKQLAAQIDAKIKSSPRGENMLEKYDSLPKKNGFAEAKHFM